MYHAIGIFSWRPVFFLFSLENRIWHLMQIVFQRDNCMKWPILFSRNYRKNIPNCRLLKFLPSMQSIKEAVYILLIFFPILQETTLVTYCFLSSILFPSKKKKKKKKKRSALKGEKIPWRIREGSTVKSLLLPRAKSFLRGRVNK